MFGSYLISFINYQARQNVRMFQNKIVLFSLSQAVMCTDCVYSEHISELLCAFRRSAPETLTVRKLTGHHAMVDPTSVC